MSLESVVHYDIVVHIYIHMLPSTVYGLAGSPDVHYGYTRSGTRPWALRIPQASRLPPAVGGCRVGGQRNRFPDVCLHRPRVERVAARSCRPKLHLRGHRLRGAENVAMDHAARVWRRKKLSGAIPSERTEDARRGTTYGSASFGADVSESRKMARAGCVRDMLRRTKDTEA